MELLPSYHLNMVIMIFFFCMCALNRFLNLEAEKELGRNMCLGDKNASLYKLRLLLALIYFINIAQNWQALGLRGLWKLFVF